MTNPEAPLQCWHCLTYSQVTTLRNEYGKFNTCENCAMHDYPQIQTLIAVIFAMRFSEEADPQAVRQSQEACKTSDEMLIEQYFERN